MTEEVKQPVFDSRGVPLEVGDYVVGHRGYYGLVAGQITKIQKMVKVEVDRSSAGGWFDRNNLIKVIELPFSAGKTNTHEFGS